MKRNNNKHYYTHSFSWELLSYYVHFLQSVFYKNIVIEGRENIPDNCPLIFAPNHQNAVMDSIAVFYATKMQIVFFARADIFSNPIFRIILRWFKILPIYRVRDGKENLQNNDASFDNAIEILKNGGQIGIFPEAQHSDKRSLLPVKKGIPRVAFMAEEKSGFNLNLKIVPVGIYYSKYNKMRSILHIKFGQAISVADYKEIYEESPQKSLLELRDEIYRRLKPLVIDIKDLNLYNTYESIIDIYVKKFIKKSQSAKSVIINKFNVSKTIIDALDIYKEKNPEKIESIKNKVFEYENLKKNYKISQQAIEKQKNNCFGLFINFLLILICMPVFIYGLLNNIFAYFIPQIVVRKIKDTQFHSSVKFVWGIFAIPIIYLIQTIAVFFIFNSFPVTLIYLISLPLTGFAARLIIEHINNFAGNFNLCRLKKTKPAGYSKLKELYNEIISELDLIPIADLK